MIKLSYEHLLTHKSIWNIKQNKPTYIVNDLELFGVPREISHKILLARGVYKWLAVRRHLIVLKNTWKRRIINTLELIRFEKKWLIAPNRHLEYYRGYLKAYEECRAEIRELCHSDRWQAPDFDREAIRFLEELDNDSTL